MIPGSISSPNIIGFFLYHGERYPNYPTAAQHCCLKTVQIGRCSDILQGFFVQACQWSFLILTADFGGDSFSRLWGVDHMEQQRIHVDL